MENFLVLFLIFTVHDLMSTVQVFVLLSGKENNIHLFRNTAESPESMHAVSCNENNSLKKHEPKANLKALMKILFLFLSLNHETGINLQILSISKKE